MFAVEELIVVTTEHNVREVVQYLPVFASRYALPEDVLLQALALLPIEIHAEHEYAGELPAARRLLADRDEDDIPLAALALKLQIPIWSNDRDYEGFPFGTFTTAQLLKILNA